MIYSYPKSSSHRCHQRCAHWQISTSDDWLVLIQFSNYGVELTLTDIDGSSGGKTTTVLHALLQDYTPSGTTQNGTSVLTTKATGPSSYFGPAPPAGQPPTHRYVFLLHAQPANFAVPAAHKQAVSSRFAIDWPKFIVDAGLSAPLYGNYLQVKSGDNTKRWVA